MATILIVDDHVLNREFLTTLLSYSGHRLLEAADGVEGLKMAHAQHPDLIISDILMPHMDGYEFVVRLRADPVLSSIQIIFYTATYREREANVMARACGVRWVLPKPSEPEQILKTVHEALGLPLHTFQHALLHTSPAENSRFASLDHQVAECLVDVEASSTLMLQLAADDPDTESDAGERQQVAQRLSKSLSSLQAVSLRLTALIELGIELAAVRDPGRLLEVGGAVVHNICVAKYAVIGMLDASGVRLGHVATRGLDDRTHAIVAAQPPHLGILGRLLADGLPQRLAQLNGDPHLLGLPVSHPPVHSFLGVAIASRERIYGWIYLVDKLGDSGFSEIDERAAATVAAQLAVAYENISLYSEIRLNHQRLQTEMADRQRAQEALRTALLARTVMATCNHVMVRATDEIAMLTQMCDNVVGIGGYRMAWIGYVNADGTLLPVVQTGAPEITANHFPPDWVQQTQGWCPAAAALHTGLPALVDDIDADAALQPWHQCAMAQGHRSAMSIPLKDAGQAFGVLTIYAGTAREFDVGRIEMFQELADDIAYGVINLRTRTAREAAERTLNATEEKLSGILNSIDNVVWSYSRDGLLYLNPIVENIYGRPVLEFFKNKSLWFQVIHPDDLAQVRNRRTKLLEQGSLIQEYRIIRPDGAIRWIENRTKVVRDDAGHVLRFDGVETDITERKAYDGRLAYMANHDALTGLANRNLLADRLAQAMRQSRRVDRLLAVLFLDLDRFKEVNDSFGHATGDNLLKAVALRLRDAIREDDTIARQGGDEFIVLLANLQQLQQIILIVSKLLNVFSEPFLIDGRKLHVTASIGVTVYPSDTDDMTTLLRNADTAMYRAKEESGNSFQFYSKEMSERTMERVELEARLRMASERNEFYVFYQPKVDIDGEQIIGAEALIRWHQPGLPTVGPARFIPVAEEIGLIVQLGDWILRQACAQNKAWQDAGLPPISVAVNLSARQFMHEGLVASVARALQDSGLAAQYLELELTESMVMNGAEHFITKMRALKALGVRLSIDDFGTGYSSLSYLKRFPIDRLKIDQSFIRDIATDPDDATITRAVIALGHSLNLKVIAEGVETREQLAFLRANQCDEAQGYYFSKPVSADEFVAMLRDADVSR